MSHIGKEQIYIPSNIKVSLEKKENIINIESKNGKLSKKISPYINIELINDSIFLKLNKKLYSRYSDKYMKSIWGMSRSLIYNMIKGVNQGYIIRLQLVGIGYKARLSESKDNLILKLGFSHTISYLIPSNVSISLLKPTLIFIKGIDKQLVTQIAAKIRSFKSPEPFNGKGIKYLNEIIKLKERK
jgi:large subunit ribosomal protein L6